jgi:molecular chaperone GrpE
VPIGNMNEKHRPKSTQKQGTKKRVRTKAPSKKGEEQLRKKLKAADKEIESLKDRLLRTAAELDNFRKRTEREFTQIVNTANEAVIKDILSAIDDLERSLKSAPKGGKAEEFHRGIELIYQKLLSILGGHGLESMESIGKDFDVDQHDALLQVEKEDTPAGIVVEEHERGYLLNGKVIRHAKVVVSK